MPTSMLSRYTAVLVLLSPLSLVGCGGGGGAPSVRGPVGTFQSAPHIPNQPLGSSAIRHVVVIIQENRSFDNMFHGFPGADSASSGASHHGNVQLQPVDLASLDDIEHLHGTFEAEYDGGNMDGFDQAGVITPPHKPSPRGADLPYSYVPSSQLQPYWQLAARYTLADRAFQSESGPSFPAHQYLIAAQSDNIPDGPDRTPWGCDAPSGTTETQLNPSGGLVPGPFPCFSYATLADELDAKGLDWRYYAPGLHQPAGSFDAYDAIRQIRYGPDWTTKIRTPETGVLSDIAAGQLGAVTWVVPSAANSDHAGTGSATGPEWVASVVDAIGASPFWDSTAIFILWDDWGGWYDHVVPPQYDLMGPGFRIPLIVVSPWARHGYVSHVTHEAVSIVKFIEDDFGLSSLGQADARADNLSDCFDFSQRPGPLQAIRVTVTPAELMRGGDAPPDAQ
ncbi:MAG: hypothetical protein JO060_06260 [Candidatus Eremiobacteraeota bacterium]|nr:hypothetical protein [Candidatus Eremiobacteraeota bacterium]